MKSIGVIPSRLGSSRFPNKPLSQIKGMSMIEHVFKRSNQVKRFVSKTDAPPAIPVPIFIISGLD